MIGRHACLLRYLTLLFYHAFIFLEVEGMASQRSRIICLNPWEGGLAICTEKYNDKLDGARALKTLHAVNVRETQELMFGQLQALTAFGKRYRATGGECCRRPLLHISMLGEPRKPSLQHSRVDLDAWIRVTDVSLLCYNSSLLFLPRGHLCNTARAGGLDLRSSGHCLAPVLPDQQHQGGRVTPFQGLSKDPKRKLVPG